MKSLPILIRMWDWLCSLLAGDPGAVRGAKRSPKWRAVEKAHLAKHPACAVCGSRRRVQVHHCLPYALRPDLELRQTNLITLCQEHHLPFGHLGDFKCFNPAVRVDAAIWRVKIRNRGLTKRFREALTRLRPEKMPSPKLHRKPIKAKPS